MHEHVEPVGDARRRPARPQRRRARAHAPAVGEDVARARARRSSPSTSTRAGLDERPRRARLQPRRLRLHDLHRQLGPLPEEISAAVNEADLAVASVLSGNRNFEGRINPDVKMNYLASPPLVVAYALAGTMDIDLVERAARARTPTARTSTCATSGRRRRRSPRRSSTAVQSDMFRKRYGEVFDGDERWNGLDVPDRRPLRVGRRTRPTCAPAVLRRACRASPSRSPTSRARASSRCSATRVTTDHISPAGAIKRGRPGRPVPARSTASTPRDFNSYGSRRGNHEVMVRGTFANIRLRNLLGAGAPRAASRATSPDGEEMSIYDAAMRYRAGGRRRSSCSAARSTARARRATGRPRARALLGVRAVIAETFERIHRSNLVGMGVLPLQFPEGESAGSARAHRRGGASRSPAWPSAERRRAAARPCTVQAGRRRVRGAGAHRHAQGGRLLPPRRDPALRPAPARRGGGVTDVLIVGDTLRSPELRHELPIAIGDPFLYAEHDGRRIVLTNVAGGRPARGGGARRRAPPRRGAGPRRAHRRRAPAPRGRARGPRARGRARGRALGARPARLPGRGRRPAARPRRGARGRPRGVRPAPPPQDRGRARRDPPGHRGRAGRRSPRRPASCARRARATASWSGRARSSPPSACARGWPSSAGAAGATLPARRHRRDDGPRRRDRARVRARPLKPDTPICFDLWPQDDASGCWTDMTRTYVVGEVSDAVGDLHRLVREAHERSLAAAAPGRAGREALRRGLRRLRGRRAPDAAHGRARARR